MENKATNPPLRQATFFSVVPSEQDSTKEVMKCDSLPLSIFMDECMEICNSRKQVERVCKCLMETMLLSGQDRLLELDDPNPYDLDPYDFL